MLVFGTTTAIIALLFTIDTLVQFLSIGTLLAYTFVSACVIILRYRPTIDTDDIAQGPGLTFINSVDIMQHNEHYIYGAYSSCRWSNATVGTM